MAAISCPGRETFRSSQTRSSTGLFTASNSRAAASDAETAVQDDLTAATNQATCEGGCTKEVGSVSVTDITTRCGRLWFTFFILVRCTATANGNVTVTCRQPEGVPGGGFSFPHLRISGDLSRHWINEQALPQNRELSWSIATGTLQQIMRTLRQRGILQAIEDQLAADSERLSVELFMEIRLEVQEDNFWRGMNLAAITFCGSPIMILINIDTLVNLTTEQATRAIIHELLHAKDCVYRNLGQPSPYPQGHDDPAFQQRENELVQMATG